MKEPFDLEKEAMKVYPYDSKFRDEVIKFGRRCADEALERAARAACCVQYPEKPCEKILALKSTASAPTERDQNALWRAERELEKS